MTMTMGGGGGGGGGGDERGGGGGTDGGGGGGGRGRGGRGRGRARGGAVVAAATRRREETLDEVLAVPYRLLQHMSPFTQNRTLPWEAYARRPKRFDGMLSGIDDDESRDDGDDDDDDGDFYGEGEGEGWGEGGGWSSTRALHDMQLASSLPPLERGAAQRQAQRGHPHPPGVGSLPPPPPRSIAARAGTLLSVEEYATESMGLFGAGRPVSRGDTGSRGMSPRSGFSDAAPMLPLL